MKVTLVELLDEYKKMTQICNNIDYSDKKTVRDNNKAVKRMYQIVDIVKTEFGEFGIYEFSKFLSSQEDRTDIWAAVQMLEKMQIDSLIEQKALTIIKQEASKSLGMEYWLKAYLAKKEKWYGIHLNPLVQVLAWTHTIYIFLTVKIRKPDYQVITLQ